VSLLKLEDIVANSRSDILDPNEVDLDRSALSIPSLVQKWSEILYEEKMQRWKIEKQYKIWRRIMWEYYTGKMSPEDLKQYNMEPFNLKLMNKDIDSYIETDAKLLSIQDALVMQELKIDMVDRKLKDITNRQWIIRAAIDHRKFMSGG